MLSRWYITVTPCLEFPAILAAPLSLAFLEIRPVVVADVCTLMLQNPPTPNMQRVKSME